MLLEFLDYLPEIFLTVFQGQTLIARSVCKDMRNFVDSKTRFKVSNRLQRCHPNMQLPAFATLKVVHLDIIGPRIGNMAALDAVRQLRQSDLETVSIEKAQIDCVGMAIVAEFLKGCTFLRTLSLASNRIADAGAAQLWELFKDCPSLKQVDLSSNLIGDAGVAGVQLLLQPQSPLCMIQLKTNKISKTGQNRGF
jgi:Ran GTPase-activating protein (RanGAP) involved in mRNA processing and transport